MAATLNAIAVKSLYEKHSAALAAYACSCGLDFASAEDVVQQLFFRLLRSEVPMPQSPLAYLYRAVKNAAFNLRRQRGREIEMPKDDVWFVAPGKPPEVILALQNALRELPEEQRDTVFLRVWMGLTEQEIADAMEISLNTVASRYRYALEKLRKGLVAEQAED